MPTSTSTTSFETTASPATVFEVLANLKKFSTWLPHSSAYKGTESASTIAAVGDDYTDQTSLGPFFGKVMEVIPDRKVVYYQSTKGDTVTIRISYELERTDSGTRVTRTGQISTGGTMRVLHPIVVSSIRSENRRTMKELSTRFEAR